MHQCTKYSSCCRYGYLAKGAKSLLADCRLSSLPSWPATLRISSNHCPLIGLWPMFISVVPAPAVKERDVMLCTVLEPLMVNWWWGRKGPLQAIPDKEERATMLSGMIGERGVSECKRMDPSWWNASTFVDIVDDDECWRWCGWSLYENLSSYRIKGKSSGLPQTSLAVHSSVLSLIASLRS